MKKLAAKIFAVVTVLMAICTSAFATGPYLGTAYDVQVFKDGSEVVHIYGEKSDVEVEFLKLKYGFIKEGKLQSTYFSTDGTDAEAKLYILSKPKAPGEKILKIYEFNGLYESVVEKEELLLQEGYEITLLYKHDDGNAKIIAYKLL